MVNLHESNLIEMGQISLIYSSIQKNNVNKYTTFEQFKVDNLSFAITVYYFYQICLTLSINLYEI